MMSTRRKILFLVLILSCAALAGLWNFHGIDLMSIAMTENPSNSLLVTFKEGQICRMNIITGEYVPIFRPHYECYKSLSTSPNDILFAFIEEKRGEFSSKESARQGRYDILPKLYLRIINHKGELVHTIEDAQKYVWSPEGERVAFITYDLKSADYPFGLPTGLWIFDIKTGDKKKIAEKAEKIVWARFDSCVYFSDWDWKKVYKWNPKTDKVGTTDYKDFYFSPDGMYYYYLPHLEVGGPIQLFERNTNKDISHILPEDLGSLSGWVFNRGHFLLFVKADVITETVGEGPVKAVKSREVLNVQNFIFDVEKKKVVKEFNGKISPWVGNGSKIIVEREGKMVFEEVPEGY